MKKIRNAVLILLFAGLGAWLVAQSPSLPGIQGFYYAGKVYKAVAVNNLGQLITSGGGGGGCTAPCAVEGTANAGAPPSGPPVQVGGWDGTNIQILKTDVNGNLFNIGTGTGTFNAGQTAVTGTAGALPSHAANSVCVKALIGNSINVYAGPSGVTTSTGFELPPGQGICEPLVNSNLIYVIASTTGASVSWTITD